MTRKVRAEAIAQAIAVARAIRALRTKTTIAGQRYFGEGELGDHHRPRNHEGRLGRLEWPIPGRKKRSRQGSSHHSSGKTRRS
eukprot:2153214-Pyramimonas_sp.AAC.1